MRIGYFIGISLIRPVAFFNILVRKQEIKMMMMRNNSMSKYDKTCYKRE